MTTRSSWATASRPAAICRPPQRAKASGGRTHGEIIGSSTADGSCSPGAVGQRLSAGPSMPGGLSHICSARSMRFQPRPLFPRPAHMGPHLPQCHHVGVQHPPHHLYLPPKVFQGAAAWPAPPARRRGSGAAGRPRLAACLVFAHDLQRAGRAETGEAGQARRRKPGVLGRQAGQQCCTGHGPTLRLGRQPGNSRAPRCMQHHPWVPREHHAAVQHARASRQSAGGCRQGGRGQRGPAGASRGTRALTAYSRWSSMLMQRKTRPEEPLQGQGRQHGSRAARPHMLGLEPAGLERACAAPSTGAWGAGSGRPGRRAKTQEAGPVVPATAAQGPDT